MHVHMDPLMLLIGLPCVCVVAKLLSFVLMLAKVALVSSRSVLAAFGVQLLLVLSVRLHLHAK